MTATVVWVAFWVAGLPSYYQQYSAAAMVWSEGGATQRRVEANASVQADGAPQVMGICRPEGAR